MTPTRDDDLIAWAKAYGPDHLRYAAERGHVITSAVLDTMAKMLADALGGRVMRPNDELIHWHVRKTPQLDSVERYEQVQAKLFAWWVANKPPGIVCYERSAIVRVEEQMDVADPSSILKYSGVVLTLSRAGTQNRFVLVNLEAGGRK